jgi:hypothetical protein
MFSATRVTRPATQRISITKYNSVLRPLSTTAAAKAKISQTIKDDHRDLEKAYHNILNAKTADEKKRWRNQFTWELARHSIGEELVLYPAFEKHLPDGKAMADKDREEHLTVSPGSHITTSSGESALRSMPVRSRNTSALSRISSPKLATLNSHFSHCGPISASTLRRRSSMIYPP